MNPEIVMCILNVLLLATMSLFWWAIWGPCGEILFQRKPKEYPQWWSLTSFFITVVTSIFLTNGGIITQFYG